MATRNTFTSLSPDFTGAEFADDIASKSDTWFNNMSLVPTTMTNVGNDYTITIDPPLKAGDDVAAGMSFFITPNANNTGATRMRVTSTNPFYDVVKSDGTALIAEEWNISSTFYVVFVNGQFRVMNKLDAATAGPAPKFGQIVDSASPVSATSVLMNLPDGFANFQVYLHLQNQNNNWSLQVQFNELATFYRTYNLTGTSAGIVGFSGVGGDIGVVIGFDSVGMSDNVTLGGSFSITGAKDPNSFTKTAGTFNKDRTNTFIGTHLHSGRWQNTAIVNTVRFVPSPSAGGTLTGTITIVGYPE